MTELAASPPPLLLPLSAVVAARGYAERERGDKAAGGCQRT